jgi:hypothetical protein
VKAAHKLLGARAIGVGSAQAGDGGGGSLRRQISPQLAEMYRAENGGFLHFLALKTPKTQFFALKYLMRYTPKMIFEEYINFKKFCNLRHCVSYTCSKFQESYMPPAIRIRFNRSFPNRLHRLFLVTTFEL